jgi:hypothetical protein
MLRFVPPRPRVPHKARWPDIERPASRTPFSRRPDLEALSVVIDAELIEDLDESVPTRELLLAGLLSHDFVQMRRYSDDGPPADAARRSSLLSMDAVDGWLVVTGFEDEPPRWGVLSVEGTSILETAILADIPKAAAGDGKDSSYADLGDSAAAEQRQRDAIAAEAAAAIAADVFITERPYLWTTKVPVGDSVLIATPLQALPLLSLYLRAQDQFIAWRAIDGRFTMSMSRGRFYSRAAVELVPHGWTVLRTVAEHAQQGGDRRLLDLMQAVFGRVQQALIARDAMYWALNRPQDNDTADELMRAFDLALLTLGGAVDASARIVQRLLDVRGPEPSWLNRAWRTKVFNASSDLKAVFGGKSSHLHALAILSALRNTIHAAQLDPLAISISWGNVTTVVKLPDDQVERLLSAMNNAGGQAAWGTVRHTSGRYLADPGTLLDMLIVRITAMLDALMTAMPIAGLSGVNPANQRPIPVRLLAESDVPSESLRWQLGV